MFCHGLPKGNLLGSKTSGLNVLELQFVVLANLDQNVFSLVLDLLKVLIFKVGIECSAGFTV